jgi:phospholipid/cholesterol/gamma-HCH transport system permease protein
MAVAETTRKPTAPGQPAAPEAAPPAEKDGWFSEAVMTMGDWGIFAARTLAWTFWRRPVKGTLADSVYFVGVLTAPVVMVTGLFIGMVLAVYAYESFKMFGMASSQGAYINLSLVKELGPVLVATMLAGRVGSAMAAELATMRITEQVDALSCLGVNPIHYLVVPRFLACLLIIPLLTILADCAGVFGGALISVQVFNIESHHYWMHTRGAIDAWDMMTGLVKPLFFGAIIALVSCQRGLNSKAGAEGVGRAATEAFVVSFVAILVVDFFLALFFNQMKVLVYSPSASVLS